jgi:ferredoxin, 2Fe-2S
MQAIRVTFVQQDGVEKTIENVTVGLSLMTVARAYGVDGILGECGGSCACATCHVYIEQEWQALVGAADAVESGTLDMVSDVQKSNSRLSCQIVARPELDGLRVTVAPLPD